MDSMAIYGAQPLSASFSVSELLAHGLDMDQIKRIIIGEACAKANEYRCPICKHNGPRDPKPEFPANEAKPSAFVMVSTPAQLLGQEMVCF